MEAAGVKCSSLTAFQNVSDRPYPLACYYDHTIALYFITRTMFRASLSTSGATRLRQLVPGEIKEPCATYPLSCPVWSRFHLSSLQVRLVFQPPPLRTFERHSLACSCFFVLGRLSTSYFSTHPRLLERRSAAASGLQRSKDSLVISATSPSYLQTCPAPWDQACFRRSAQLLLKLQSKLRPSLFPPTTLPTSSSRSVDILLRS